MVLPCVARCLPLAAHRKKKSQHVGSEDVAVGSAQSYALAAPNRNQRLPHCWPGWLARTTAAQPSAASRRAAVLTTELDPSKCSLHWQASHQLTISICMRAAANLGRLLEASVCTAVRVKLMQTATPPSRSSCRNSSRHDIAPPSRQCRSRAPLRRLEALWLTAGLDPRYSLIRGVGSSSPEHPCQVHCSLRGKGGREPTDQSR
jgi:hypothetical protein